MFSGDARWRLVVGFTAAIGGSFLAGCCGGPFGADDVGGGCAACAEARAAESDCAVTDAGSDASDSMAGASSK
jgi:hypothetical protein